MLIPLSPQGANTPKKVTEPAKSTDAKTGATAGSSAAAAQNTPSIRGTESSSPVKHATPQMPDRASERRVHDRPVVQTPRRSETHTVEVPTVPAMAHEERKVVAIGR